jgi:hypothetical protein
MHLLFVEQCGNDLVIDLIGCKNYIAFFHNSFYSFITLQIALYLTMMKEPFSSNVCQLNREVQLCRIMYTT